jgi:hypothetical protein
MPLQLDEFDPVAEGIVDVTATHPGDLVVGSNRNACGFECGAQGVEAPDLQRRMSIARGAKIGLDAEVDLDGALLEPAAATDGEGRRLRNAFQA